MSEQRPREWVSQLGYAAQPTTGGLEVMDSWLISFGASIANDFLLPDEDVRADLHRLLVRGHSAFASDLARFGRLPQTQ